MNTKKNNADKQNKEKDQPAATADEETSGRPVEGEPEGPIDSLEDLKQQLENQSDRYLRLMAEFDNFKKRVSRDYERLVESANEKLMGELIEVRENFERAIKTDEKCSDPTSILRGRNYFCKIQRRSDQKTVSNPSLRPGNRSIRNCTMLS